MWKRQTSRTDDDMVCSTWEHVAGYNSGGGLTTLPEHKVQYGAGARSIAANNGLTVPQAQGFIDAYYSRYSELKAFQDRVMAEVNSSLIPSSNHTAGGYPLMKGYYTSITGRRYCFQQQETPDFIQKKSGVMGAISPTQIANYPMQGFATGDIVPHVLGKVVCHLVTTGLYRPHVVSGLGTSTVFRVGIVPINTVHDSIIFDVHKQYLPDMRFVKNIMEDAPKLMKEHFGIDISLPLHVDMEYGKSWATLTKLKF